MLAFSYSQFENMQGFFSGSQIWFSHSFEVLKMLLWCYFFNVTYLVNLPLH